MPPEPPRPPKKHLLENPFLKAVFAFMALAAPVPVLLVLINCWLASFAPDAVKGADPFAIFRQIMQGGPLAPAWLVPAAVLPSLLLLMVMFRTGAGRIAGAAALVLCTAAAMFGFMQMISL